VALYSHIFFPMFSKISKFTREVRVELAKAQWPWDPNEKGFRRYKEITDSTVVVFVAMIILGGYIAFFDFILINVVGFLTRS
jgi:preprotein translocase subunit SecE